jgi:hypothetical protein
MRPHGTKRTLAAATLTAVTIVVIATLALAMSGCGGSNGSEAESPAPTDTASAPGGAAGGTKLAPGLYDLEDGTVQAVGTVEYRDLEGGFWAVVGGTQAEGDEGEVVAVIVNGEEFAEEFRANDGLSFVIDGERAGEASIRMAGPEITATRVTLAAEGGPAE